MRCQLLMKNQSGPKVSDQVAGRSMFPHILKLSQMAAWSPPPKERLDLHDGASDEVPRLARLDRHSKESLALSATNTPTDRYFGNPHYLAARRAIKDD